MTRLRDMVSLREVLAYVDDISVVKASVGNELLADPNFDKGRWELEGDMSYTYDVYYQETPASRLEK